jgi:glucuronate isomerase
MNSSLDSDSLLSCATGKVLFHEVAHGLPIVDYHSHLNSAHLAEDVQFDEMTALWIAPDQYKHRVLRVMGENERFITGDASPREKFDCWASAMPKTAGNPIFHWSALELKNYFGIEEPLNEQSADRIWNECNRQLRQPTHSARALLHRAAVERVCTSDQWLDDLSAHRKLALDATGACVRPSLRADEALATDVPVFKQWISKLGAAKGIAIDGLDAFEDALCLCLDEFAAAGCTVADHGIDVFLYTQTSREKAQTVLDAILLGREPGPEDAIALRSYMLRFLGAEYNRRGWAMLLHIGAKRETSSRLRAVAGPRGGFAGIGNGTDISSLCRFLDELDRDGLLPRTVLFNLNPSDNEAFATLTGSFAEEGCAGKVQFGPAWWFNDHDLGIRAHLNALSRYGLLWNLAGMATDSRSVLSMCRFEYFRRIFCDWIGGQAEAGVFPRDMDLLATYVRRICYENAHRWFSARGKGE